MKRFGLGMLGLLVVLAVMGYALRKTITLRLVERLVERNMASNLLDELPDGLHVALCGAGSPLPDPKRSGPCTAVGEGRIVLERDGLTITAFVVDHSPVRPAVGYRFDFRGRSVVVSGDTKKNSNLQRFAAGVDLLVHEALNPQLVGLLNQGAERAGRVLALQSYRAATAAGFDGGNLSRRSCRDLVTSGQRGTRRHPRATACGFGSD